MSALRAATKSSAGPGTSESTAPRGPPARGTIAPHWTQNFAPLSSSARHSLHFISIACALRDPELSMDRGIGAHLTPSSEIPHVTVGSHGSPDPCLFIGRHGTSGEGIDADFQRNR